MKKSQSHRPALAVESLEGRLVLNGGSLTQELATVAAAFKTFEQTYANDVNTELFRPTWTTHGVSVNTVANRTAFNTSINTALNTLTSKITSSVAVLNLGTNGTNALTTTIESELLSSNSTYPANLQTVLTDMATPTPGKFAAQDFTFLADLNIGTAQREIDAAITAEFNG